MINDVVGLGRVAEKLLEKISDAVGTVAAPWQIKRLARAEAQADLIKAESQIEITETQRRGLLRLVNEEGKRQENIENITAKSIPHLKENAAPESIKNDWYSNFFERNRNVSNEEMQEYWAKMLALQVNKSASFSKRTIEIVQNFELEDFQIFNKFAASFWMFPPLWPLIYKLDTENLQIFWISFDNILHLESLGLIRIDTLGGFGYYYINSNLSDQEIM